jgi:hypothetical protein
MANDDTWLDAAMRHMVMWKSPNFVLWIDEETCLPCFIVRRKARSPLGFVGVDRTNVAHGIKLGAKTLDYALVGDGIMFAGFFPHELGIPATPGENGLHADDKIWWFGFSKKSESFIANEDSCADSSGLREDCCALARWLSQYPSG